MNEIHSIVVSSENISPRNSLPAWAGVTDNTATTKQTAVKPSRHSLAIFVPKICEPTKPTFTTGIKQRHILNISIFGYIASYVGLRKPTKIPLVGNKLRRLFAVVIPDTLLFLGVQILTKQTGGHTHA